MRFFPAQQRLTTKNPPFIVWFQGGPGSSGLIGLFFEIGPYDLNLKRDPPEIEWRKVGNWNKNYNLLFIDQPVGTG